MRKIGIIFAVLLAMSVGQTKSQSNMNTTESNKEQIIGSRELGDRMQIRALVDKYAVESDKGNQEAYREIFVKDLNLKVFTGNNVSEFHNVEDMITAYKAGGKAKVSFHQTGQQYVEFQDSTHAAGVVYLTALLVDDKDVPTHIYIRYNDKYRKIDGRWWITDRDQHMLFMEH